MTPERVEQMLQLSQVRRGLYIIRFADIDPDDQYHRDLLYSLEACPPESSDGDLVTAIRFVTGQAKYQAASEHVAAKNAAKVMMRQLAREERQSGRISQSAAERLVEESSDDYWELKMRADLAEVRAGYLTDMLYALEASLKNYQTTRADERAMDSWHARQGV